LTFLKKWFIVFMEVLLMEIRQIIDNCQGCGCPFFAGSNRVQHSLLCAAADSKFGFGEVVRAKGVENSLFAKMIIVSVVPGENGAPVYNAQAMNCHSLVITGGENDFDFWEELKSESC
jgi:hypothetical protein